MQCKSLWIKASAKCINVNVNTVPVKSLDPLLFLMFLNEISYAHQACIYFLYIYNNNNNNNNNNNQQGCVYLFQVLFIGGGGASNMNFA